MGLPRQLSLEGKKKEKKKIQQRKWRERDRAQPCREREKWDRVGKRTHTHRARITLGGGKRREPGSKAKTGRPSETQGPAQLLLLRAARSSGPALGPTTSPRNPWLDPGLWREGVLGRDFVLSPLARVFPRETPGVCGHMCAHVSICYPQVYAV